MLTLLGSAALGVGAGLPGRRRWELELVADHDFRPLMTSPLVSEEVHHEKEALARGELDQLRLKCSLQPDWKEKQRMRVAC